MVAVLIRDLHLSVGELDRMTAAELRWWIGLLAQARAEERRIASERRGRTS